jgi:hypothetical protein
VIQTYFAKFKEISELARINRVASYKTFYVEWKIELQKSFIIRLGSHSQVIDLDIFSTIDRHDQLLGSSRECFEGQAEYAARERVIIAKLGEIAELEEKIMAYLDSKPKNSRASARAQVERKRAVVSRFRLRRLEGYKKVISQGSWRYVE